MSIYTEQSMRNPAQMIKTHTRHLSLDNRLRIPFCSCLRELYENERTPIEVTNSKFLKLQTQTSESTREEDRISVAQSQSLNPESTRTGDRIQEMNRIAMRVCAPAPTITTQNEIKTVSTRNVGDLVTGMFRSKTLPASGNPAKVPFVVRKVLRRSKYPNYSTDSHQQPRMTDQCKNALQNT